MSDRLRCVLCKEGAGSNAERCPTCAELGLAIRRLTEPDEPEPSAVTWGERDGLRVERAEGQLDEAPEPRPRRLESGRGH